MNLFSELVLETDEETGNQSNKLIKDFIGGFLCALGSTKEYKNSRKYLFTLSLKEFYHKLKEVEESWLW